MNARFCFDCSLVLVVVDFGGRLMFLFIAH